MSVERVYLCAIPRGFWSNGQDFARFVDDALQCERRIAKGINLDTEFGRYTICCQRLEQEVLLSGFIQPIRQIDEFETVVNSGRFPSVAISMEYLNLLHLFTDQKRFGVTFFTPSMLRDHLQSFITRIKELKLTESLALRQRVSFLNSALKSGCGIVEIQSAFHLGTYAEQRISPPPLKLEEEFNSQFVEIPDFSRSDEVSESFGSSRKREMASRLRGRIFEALRNGEPVAFGSDAQHDVITEILNDLVFVPEGEKPRPAMLRVMYVDGSEAAPFPLFCLDRRSFSTDLSVLRVSLMSMRHPELDPEIDYCWFRNREVSRTRTLSETDDFCRNASTTQLNDMLKSYSTHLHMYHTGFEPAIIGFYRSVTQLLINSPTRQHLAVTPFYFRGADGYQEGRVWC